MLLAWKKKDSDFVRPSDVVDVLGSMQWPVGHVSLGLVQSQCAQYRSWS